MKKNGDKRRSTFHDNKLPDGTTDYKKIFSTILCFPGGLSFCRIVEEAKAGRVPREYVQLFQRLVDGIFITLNQAHKGNEVSKKQLKAVEEDSPSQHIRRPRLKNR